MYEQNRQYDPPIGSIRCPDPANLAGGINLYTYAPNPLNWIDPLGLCATGKGKGRGWLNHARIWHDQRADAIFGAGKGKTVRTSLGNRFYDKEYKGRDIEFKSDNFSNGPRSKESLDRMNRQIDKDALGKEAGTANPHWHFEHDPTKADEMKPILDKLKENNIPWT